VLQFVTEGGVKITCDSHIFLVFTIHITAGFSAMMHAFSRRLFCNISGTPEVLGQCEVSHGIMPILQCPEDTIHCKIHRTIDYKHRYLNSTYDLYINALI